MRGFLESVVNEITNSGGSIHTGQNITDIKDGNTEMTVKTIQGSKFIADCVVSTVAPETFHNLLEPEIKLPEPYCVPWCSLFGEYNKNDLNKATYLHNFNPNQKVFAIQISLYSDQVNKDGRTFICVECPCSELEFLRASDEEISETILSELQELNWVDKHVSHSATKVLKIPKAIPIPSYGTAAKRKKISQALARKFPNFLHFFSDAYSKAEIIKEGLEFTKSLNAFCGRHSC